MTITTRKVLADLRHVHEMLEVEEDITRFRVLWVAAISLARAVGHVLHKIDAPSSPRLQAAVAAAYTNWQNNPHQNTIFFEFIESERNSVLKEYEFGFLSGPVDLVVLPEGSTHTLSDNLFCPIGAGPYAGEDCRDILGLAITWWESKLNEVEQAAAILL